MAARSTIDDFDVLERLGHGTYGTVYRVMRKLDGQCYAMKEIDLEGMSEKEQQDCIQETRVLSSLSSPYIIKYYDSFLHDGKLCIVTEYASNGNLHDYIQRQKRKLPEELVWRLFIQVLLGLNHMHSCKVLHRDIKTLNVFLDEALNVKLGDMGVAKVLTSSCSFAQSLVGTPYYLSPELCEDRPYNYKSDVWALGVVLYECCTQKHPFDADNQGALILKILRGKYPPVSGYSPDIIDLVKRCLTQNVVQRPNTTRLLQLQSIRLKAAELGIALPQTSSTAAPAAAPLPVLATPAAAAAATPEKRPPAAKRVTHAAAKSSPSILKTGDSPSPIAHGIREPPAAAVGPSNRVRDRAGAGQASRPIPSHPSKAPGQGVIRVVGDMNKPSSRPPQPSSQTSFGMAAGVTLQPITSSTVKTRHAAPGRPPAQPTQKARSDADADVLQRLLEPSPSAERSASVPFDPHVVDSLQGLDLDGATPSVDFVPANGGLRIRKLVGADKAFVFGAGSASCGHIHVSVSGTELTSGGEPDDEDAQEAACTWPLEAGWKVVCGRPSTAAGGGEDGDNASEGAPSTSSDEASDAQGGDSTHQRRQRLQLALMLQKEACVKSLGQDTFLRLYASLRMQADDVDVPVSVLQSHPNAMQMLFKLLYLEEQLEALG